MTSSDFQVRRRLALRRSGIHGKGVFAREPIPAGTRLIEYRGERIPPEEGDARYPYDPSVPYHTFLFEIDAEVVVDAGRGGNMSRWINHSCAPNCDAVIEGGRIFIESVRDIAEGEELTYDYNFVLEERHTPAAKRRFPCVCGAPGCRGTMLARKR
jgi:SET domain-containing protein